jgi:hypothetical protein
LPFVVVEDDDDDDGDDDEVPDDETFSRAATMCFINEPTASFAVREALGSPPNVPLFSSSFNPSSRSADKAESAAVAVLFS